MLSSTSLPNTFCKWAQTETTGESIMFIIWSMRCTPQSNSMPPPLTLWLRQPNMEPREPCTRLSMK